MRLKLLLFFLIFTFFSTNVFSKPRCDIFYEKIKTNYDVLKLDQERITTIKSIGFDLQVIFDKNMARITQPGDSQFKIDDYVSRNEVIKINKDLKKNKKKPIFFQDGDWDMDRSSKGYFMVGKIYTQEMAEKVKPYDLIISINGKDLRDLDLSKKTNSKNIKNLEDYFSKDENLIIELQGRDEENKTYNYLIETQWTEFDYADPFIDFYIRSVQLDEKDGTSNISIETEYEEILSANFPLTKLASEILSYKGEEDEVQFEECEYTIKEWKDLDTIDPHYGMVYKDLIYQDKTLFEGKYLIYPTLVGTADWVTEDTLSILYKTKGQYKFKNDFNFRSFPFDKQKIKIFVYQSRYELGAYQASISDWTKRELLALEKQNPITGWNIIGNKIDYKTYKGPNDQLYFDGVELTLDIERKSGYYIFKVILPIILILIVCWSAVWINPKEIESRLTITIVCLLSLIAYNFVIDSEMPKLEYLTIMDYIVLISYIYATIPNFLSIAAFNLIGKNKKLCQKYENYGKRYGLLSYLMFILLTIVVNTNSSPEHTNAMLSWIAPS